MRVRDRAMAGLASQLGLPVGVRGRLVVRMLNRANRRAVLAAIAATGLQAGEVGADLGFGGGVGLTAMLDRVGQGGHVHGVEVSDTALTRARARWAGEVATGRLSLHRGDLRNLPLPDAAVDAAITVNTLYFVANVEPVFAELARVVRPGGRVVVGVGDPENMRGRPFTGHGFALRDPEGLLRSMADAGFIGGAHERVGDSQGAFHLLVAQRPRLDRDPRPPGENGSR